MKRPENDKWLDDALSETIGSEETRTDFEQWKQKHPEAVDMLTSRAKSKSLTIKGPNIWRMILRSPITKIAAAVLIASVAFLGGRLSMPRTLSPSKDDAPPVVAEADGVNVPNELIAWLEAARLFKQLGMEDRMARAVERAGRLLPADTFIADDQSLRVFAAGSIGNQTERVEPMGILSPHPSAESINQILAQSF